MTDRLSWRKSRGDVRQWGLYRGHERLAVCEQIPSGQWYWIGLGRVIPSKPQSLDYCKTEAMVVAKGANAGQ